MKSKPKEISVARPTRPPDCVTVTRIGNMVLTVNGFCAPDEKETLEDKLVKLMKVEAARNLADNTVRAAG